VAFNRVMASVSAYFPVMILLKKPNSMCYLSCGMFRFLALEMIVR
jgi:hypothetical protein